MNDRKLLEMAAKAAGIQVWRGRNFQSDMLFRSPKVADPEGRLTGIEWNPLKDDGDAFRLMVALNINFENITKLNIPVELSAYPCGRGDCLSIVEVSEDKDFDTRRSIVFAAAKLGELMP